MNLPNINKFDYDVNFDTPFKQKLEDVKKQILDFIERCSSSDTSMSGTLENDIDLVLLDYYSNRIAKFLISAFIKNNKRGITDPDNFVWPHEVIEIDPETKEKIKQEIGPKQREVNGKLVDTDKIFSSWFSPTLNPENPKTETQAKKNTSLKWIKDIIEKMNAASKSAKEAFKVFDSNFDYDKNVPQIISDIENILKEIETSIKTNSDFLKNRSVALNDKTNKYATGFTREEYMSFSENITNLISRIKEANARIKNNLPLLRSKRKTRTSKAAIDIDRGRISELLHNSIIELNTVNYSINSRMKEGLVFDKAEQEKISEEAGYVDLPKSVIDDIQNAVKNKIFRSPLVYADLKPKESNVVIRSNKIESFIDKVEKRIKEIEEKNRAVNAEIDNLKKEYHGGNIQHPTEKREFFNDREMLEMLGKIGFLNTKKIDVGRSMLRMIVNGDSNENITVAMDKIEKNNAAIDEEAQKIEKEYNEKMAELTARKIKVPQKLTDMLDRLLAVQKSFKERATFGANAKDIAAFYDNKNNYEYRMAHLIQDKIVPYNKVRLKKSEAEELLNFCVLNGVRFTTIDPSLIKYSKVNETSPEDEKIDEANRIVLSGVTIYGHLADMYVDTKKNIERFVNYKIDDMIEKMDFI